MAINGFEEITYELTDYEINVLLPIMERGLRKRIGKENAITSNEILDKCVNAGYKLNSARIRKLINYIRVNHVIPFLMDSSKGYYIEHDKVKMIEYIESLEKRAKSIINVSVSLRKQLNNRFVGV